MFWNITLWLTAMQFFVITSGSMQPALPVGSVVATKTTTLPYVIGDVIAFRSSRGVITHRVVDRRQLDDHWYYLTRGDANPTVDPDWITNSSIVGIVVWHIPYVGYSINILKTPIGFVLLILLPSAILILQELLVMKQAWQELRAPVRLLPISLVWLIGSLSLLIPLAHGLLITNTVALNHNIFQVGSTSNNPCEFNVNIHFENSNTGPNSINTNQAVINHECTVNVH